MKKILLLAIAVMAVACGSPEKTCQTQITDTLKKTLLDPSSYESLAFSQLDSLFSSPRNHPDYNALEDAVKDIDNQISDVETDIILAKNWDEEKSLRQKKIDLVSAKIKALEDIDAYEKNFKGTWLGWEMTHRFKATTKIGLLSIHEKKYYFDKEYKMSDFASLLIKEGVR